jgi:hypothetical protein
VVREVKKLKDKDMTRTASDIWRNILVMGFLPFYLFTFLPLHAQVGTWRNYLAYHEVQQIQAAGDDIFVLASNGLYQYNLLDQSIYTYDKTNGLTDSNIGNIRWCKQAKRLVATYSNTNIDLIDTKGNVVNVSDIYLKAITGDKSINSVTIEGPYAYLSCGFGIVKLNVKDAEISESYMFGRNVTKTVVSDGYIYARISETYQYSNPEDFVIPFNGTVTIPANWNDNKAHTLVYVLKGSLSDNLIDIKGWTVTTTYPSFDEDTSDYEKYQETVSTLNPGGPHYNGVGLVKFLHGRLYTAYGDFYSQVPIQILNNQEWEIYDVSDVSETTRGLPYRGPQCFDVDPSNPNHIFAGSQNGLYEFKDGKLINFYNSDNSPIEGYNGVSKNNQWVTGVKFDQNSDVWFLNSSAPTTALVKLSNGTFTKKDHSELMKLNTSSSLPNRSNGKLVSMMIDSEGLMWFCNNNWTLPAFYKYQMDTDNITAYESFTNQDGTVFTSTNGIRCVVEDLDKNIWIGTDMGPLVYERQEINKNGTTFTQVKVPRNDGTNFADYLLSGIDIQCIAVDGAGRKWFGTNGNGVYLISADNMEQIHHFTKENSPLISNTVLSIAINATTGEVYFGSLDGLCSYRSDATQTNTEMNTDNVWAYPNPVTPDYTGPITVTGLTMNADVKIVASNGALVNEGRSNGGTFIWDGCDKKGRRVASGVYMVVTATRKGEKGTVCKIAVVR